MAALQRLWRAGVRGHRSLPGSMAAPGVEGLPGVLHAVRSYFVVRGCSMNSSLPGVRNYSGVKGIYAYSGLAGVRGYSWVKGLPGVRGHSGAPHLQPPKDVVLFQHRRPRFFRLLGLFCLAQGGFWAYLGHYGFSSLRDTGAHKGARVGAQEGSAGGHGGPGVAGHHTHGPPDTSPGGKKLNLGSRLWRYGFTLTCFTVGSLILAAGFLFSRRSVSQVILHRGGQQVTFHTSFPFGPGSSFTVPLRHVSCMAHRSEVPSVIPLKIKGHPLYFLLDKQGQVLNVKLFDVTVGTYRKL